MTPTRKIKSIHEITRRIQMQLRSSGVRRAPNKLSPSLQKRTRKKLKNTKTTSRSDLSPNTCPAPSPQSLQHQNITRPAPPTKLSVQPSLAHVIESPSSFTKQPTYVPHSQQPLPPPIHHHLPASPSIQNSFGSLNHLPTRAPHSQPPLHSPIQQHTSSPMQQQTPPPIQQATRASCPQPSHGTSPPAQQQIPPPIQQVTRAPRPQPSQHTSPSCIQQPTNVPSVNQPSSSHFLNHEAFNVEVHVPSIPKSIRSKPQAGKHKRGVVNGFRLHMKTRTSKKIYVEVGADGKNPKCPEIRSLLVHEIGSCIRDNVPMIAPRYTKLPKDQWEVVPRHLSTNFELPPNEEWLWDFILKIAKNRYKDWKCKCKKHFVESGEELPQEFVYRPEQWEWLVNHFKDPLQQKKCVRMKRIRRECPRINHHSGKLPLHHRAELLSRDGVKLPYIAAYEHVYGSDPNGAEILKEVNDKARELLEERGVFDLELVEDPLTMHEQMEIIDEVINKRKGNKPKGRPRKSLQSYIDMQEEIKKTKDEALAKEAAAAEREAAATAKLMAVEERLRKLEELLLKTNQSTISSDASYPNHA